MSVLTDIIKDSANYTTAYIFGGVNRLGRQYYGHIKQRGLSAIWPIPTLDGYGDSGIVINWSFPLATYFNRIPGGFCDVTLKADTFNQLRGIALGDDSQWLLEVYEKDSTDTPVLIFKGFIIPSTYRQEHGYHEPIVSFTATDGLGLLKEIKFLEDEKLNDEPLIFPDVKGEFPLKDIISYLLSKAGNVGNWRDCIAYTKYPEGHFETPYNYSYYFKRHVWDYWGKNCYEVLNDILSILEAQVVFIGGEYRIRLPDQPFYSHYDIYSYQGVLLSSGESTKDNEKDLYSDFDGGTGLVEVTGNIRNLILERKFRKWNNLIYNADFSKGAEGYFNSGETWPWGGVSSPMVDINEEEGFVVIRPVLESYWLKNWWKIDFPALATSIDRGLYVGTKVRVSFEARRNTPDEYTPGFDGGMKYEVYVGMYGSQPTKAAWTSSNDPAEWHKVEVVTSINTAASERWFCMYPMYFAYSIQNLVIVALQPTVGEVELLDELEDDVIVVNKNNRADRTIALSYFNQNIPYRYRNVFPGGSEMLGGNMIERSTSIRMHQYPFLRTRLTEHYLYSRIRFSGFTAYRHADSPLINPEVVLYDKYWQRLFYVINYSYNLRLCRYDLELLEQKRKAYIPPSEPQWILAEGVWNDEGIWIDTDAWKDAPD